MTEWRRAVNSNSRDLLYFRKDSLPKASEKVGLIIDPFCHSEKLGYFLERVIAALRPAIANFRAAVSAEKDN